MTLGAANSSTASAGESGNTLRLGRLSLAWLSLVASVEGRRAGKTGAYEHNSK